jgi:hypothetical protein
MRNVLRLETKGCRGKIEDELEGEKRGKGKGKGAYVICLIWGGVLERLWGIPREIPDYRMSRGVTRRGEARGRKRPFVLGDLESWIVMMKAMARVWHGMACHATPRHSTLWRVPCHRIPKVIVGR